MTLKLSGFWRMAACALFVHGVWAAPPTPPPPKPAPMPAAAPTQAPSGAASGATLAAPGVSDPAAEGTHPAVNNPPSASAQRLYDRSRSKLLQVRTLLRGQDSQASVGSGFIVTDEGHIVTNYHVVSQVALQPDRYRLVYSSADGKDGPLQLLAFDVIHDLALVRPTTPANLAGHGALGFRPRDAELHRGERIYSLGNPLDVGFAVVEGNYNGLVERSFYPTIFFAGSLNPGMSGGPTLDEQGRVVGINVAARRDGEQVSFLVPMEFAATLLERGRGAEPIKTAVYPELTRQLLSHQDLMTQRFLRQPWRGAGHKHYRIPVPQEEFIRCWGSNSPSDSKGLQFERSDCEMDTNIFVSGRTQTGNMSVRHEAYDGTKLGVLRFSQRYSESFRNEAFGPRGGRRQATTPQCHERYIESAGLPLRAVMCMTAYTKLPGLFDMSLLVATLDEALVGVQGRFDVHGVSFDNALKLGAHYVQGFGWQQANKTGLR